MPIYITKNQITTETTAESISQKDVLRYAPCTKKIKEKKSKRLANDHHSFLVSGISTTRKATKTLRVTPFHIQMNPFLGAISLRGPLAPICTWVHILEFGNIRYDRTRK